MSDDQINGSKTIVVNPPATKGLDKIVPEVINLTVCNGKCAYGWVKIPGYDGKFCLTLVHDEDMDKPMIQVYGFKKDYIIDISNIMETYNEILDKRSRTVNKFKHKAFKFATQELEDTDTFTI